MNEKKLLKKGKTIQTKHALKNMYDKDLYCQRDNFQSCADYQLFIDVLLYYNRCTSFPKVDVMLSLRHQIYPFKNDNS